MKRWVLFTLAVVAFAGSACKSGDHKKAGGNVIQAYYMPIGIETLTPVTSENIEKRGDKFTIDSQDEIDLLKRLISSGRPPSPPNEVFTDKGVRVKLIEKTPQGDALLAVVENEGYVKRTDGHDQVLSPKDLAALKKLMEKHSK